MAFLPIDPNDVDFKSPIDETLMDLIRTNFDDHESRLSGLGTGGTVYQFKVNGALSNLKTYINNLQDSLAYQLDGSFIPISTSFSKVRMFLRKTGDSGQTKIDIKAKTRVDHTITDIDYQMELATQSVGILGSSLATQSITNATPTINIQAINYVKSQVAIDEIISLGNNRYRLNFNSAALDADYKTQAIDGGAVFVNVTGATNASNNGEHPIVEVGQDGGQNVVITNVSGVEEFSSPAQLQLQMFEFVFSNPVDSNFVVGEEFEVAGTTDGFFNNGRWDIERVNSGGNNILTYIQLGKTQAAPAGTVECLRFVYTFTSPVLTTDYVIGEKINATSHTNGLNNGKYEIVAINDGGNNITVINRDGLPQAGVAGFVNTNRWIYSVNTAPSLDIAVNDRIAGFSHTSSNNDGTFVVVELERSALNNIIVYNENGVTQGSPAGTLRSEKMVVSFASDLSSNYTVDRSFVTIKNTYSTFIGEKLYLPVVEVNRGGGANYNIVIKVDEALTETNSFAQNFIMGQVDMISKSLFSTLPVITAGENPDFGGASAVFYPDAVAADSILSLDLVEVADGFEVFDLSVDLS